MDEHELVIRELREVAEVARGQQASSARLPLTVVDDLIVYVGNLQAENREWHGEVRAAELLASTLAAAVGWETEGATWQEKAEKWRVKNGPLTDGPDPHVQNRWVAGDTADVLGVDSVDEEAAYCVWDVEEDDGPLFTCRWREVAERAAEALNEHEARHGQAWGEPDGSPF